MRRQLRYLLLLTALLVLTPGWTQAAEITVDAGGVCTLADAIRSANRNQDLNGCVGEEEPYGDDIIILETDVDLESGHAERPPIMSYYETDTGACTYSGTVTIEGQGHTIDGMGGDGYVLKISRSMYEGLEEYECSYGGVLTVNNATITGGNHAASSTNANMPGNGGGFVNAYSGELTLNNVTVNGNTAAGNGGGIFNARNGILMLNNVTVSGNTVAGDGGGVYMEVFPAAGNSTLNHVTITGNIAEGQGGGIYMSKLPMGGTVALKSSVVISNTALTSDGGNEIFCSGSFTSDSDFNLFGHSDETDAQAFSGFTPGSSDVNATSDGESIPLASILDTMLTDNGGSALTHALVLGSPAIDLDATCSTGLDTDQRSYPRPETEGAGCDAGSFEFSNNCTSNIIVDVDGICTLADAITAANTNAPSGGCPAGCDNDTITLETDVLLDAALPEITSPITIEGQGHTIDGNNDPTVGSVLTVIPGGGNLTLNETIITGGNASLGGGIFTQGILMLNKSTVNNNSANLGGGIYSWGGKTTLIDSTISGNSADSDGGGLFNFAGSRLTLIQSTVSGNTAAGNGGGLLNVAGNVTLDNSTISDNTAVLGGGIRFNDNSGSLTLNSSIISGNTAEEGKEIYNGSGNTLTLNNYNVFGHSGETTDEALHDVVPHSSAHLATSDGTEPTPLDAILYPLADNGGPTETHALVLGSLAIDLDEECSVGLSADQRGYPRPVGNVDCDAGAVEFSSSDIIVDAGGTCTLADAITAANTDAPSGGCPAGCGDDTIILKTNVTLDAQLPAITSPITIEGKGYTIDGNGGDWPVLIISVDGDLTLNEATVTGADHTSGFGGGIHNSGTVMLTNSTVSGNSTDNDGGGIFNVDTITLFNSTVNGNSSINGYGGGIVNSGTVTLNKSTISGNTASDAGGGITNIGTVTLNDSTISGNTGGGIDNYYSTSSVTVTNSTISGNTGGGISNDNSTVTLINSTVTENTVGGGIISFGNSELILKSSIISGNTFSFDTSIKGNEVWNNGSVITSDSFNLFGHSGESSADAFNGFTPGSTDRTATSDGTKPTELAAILSPLADNGGLTMTHALVPGSPAIDLDASCSTGLDTDQRGEPRPETEGTGCDAGAFEGSVSSNKAFLPAIYLLLLNN